jgi:hypothetical protein
MGQQHVAVFRCVLKLRKAAVSFVMSVRLSVCLSACPSSWKTSAPTGRIFMKLNIRLFFENLSKKNQISLKCDNNNGYLTLRPIYVFDHISLSVLLRIRTVSNKFVEKSKMHILCSITLYPKVEAFISNVFMVK